MEKILIPTDFSKCADAALDFVVQTAKISHVEIIAIHVSEFYPILYGDPVGMSAVYPLAYKENAEKELLTIKNRLMTDLQLTVTTKVYDAPVLDAILKAAKDFHANLVVMGTHGGSGIGEKLFGSQSASMIARGGLPVLLIPCKYKWKAPKKIVLATNGFEKESSVLEFLLDFVEKYHADLHIVVFTNDDKDKAVTLVEHEYHLKNYSEMIERRYGISTVSRHIYGDDLEEALETYIKENSIDILAMVTHKRTMLGRIFNPSKTKRISGHHLKVPLLALPSKAKPSE